MPTDAGQGFYRRMGFTPAIFVHRELYENEPEDIHVIRRL